MVAVSLKSTLQFFDKKAVMRGVERAERRVLSRQGFLVQKQAKKSIRFRKNKHVNSRPGQVPFSHSKHRTRNLKYIFYIYDARLHTVIVGPVHFGKNSILKALEQGGSAMANVGGGHKVNRHIQARPFMFPALQHESPKFARMWRDSIR